MVSSNDESCPSSNAAGKHYVTQWDKPLQHGNSPLYVGARVAVRARECFLPPLVSAIIHVASAPATSFGKSLQMFIVKL